MIRLSRSLQSQSDSRRERHGDGSWQPLSAQQAARCQRCLRARCQGDEKGYLSPSLNQRGLQRLWTPCQQSKGQKGRARITYQEERTRGQSTAEQGDEAHCPARLLPCSAVGMICGEAGRGGMRWIAYPTRRTARINTAGFETATGSAGVLGSCVACQQQDQVKRNWSVNSARPWRERRLL